MLVRTWAAPEPAVVRQIEHPAWPTPVADKERPAQIVTKMVIKPSAPIVVRHCIARENDFVTNQRQHVGCARYRQVAPPIASNEGAASFGKLAQAQPLERVLKREIFAKRHEIDLVVDRSNSAVRADYVNGIVSPRDRFSGCGLRWTNSPCDQHGTLAQQGGNLSERVRLPGEKKW